MADKRIYDLTTTTALTTKFLAVDKSGNAEAEKFDAGQLVTLSGSQTITGTKTFTSRVQIGDVNTYIRLNGTQLELTDAVTGSKTLAQLAAPGVSFGTSEQIPFVNVGGTDFTYSAGLKYATGILETTGLKITALSVSTIPEAALAYVVGSGDGTFGTSAALTYDTTTGFLNVGGVDLTTLRIDGATTNITKDGSNNMVFTDAVTGSKTLAELAASQILTLGASGQIPYMNAGATDFSYSAGLNYTTGILTASNVSVSAIAAGTTPQLVTAAVATGALVSHAGLTYDGATLNVPALQTTGNITLGGSIRLPAATNRIYFGDNDTYIYESTDDRLIFVLGGSTMLYFDSTLFRVYTVARFDGALSVYSASDTILRLQQTDLTGTPGTPTPGWNYVSFYDGDGDRQGYFGIDTSGNMRFIPEITGGVLYSTQDVMVANTKNFRGFATGQSSLGTSSIWFANSFVNRYYVENASTYISKGIGGDLYFSDAVTGGKTLAQLSGPGVSLGTSGQIPYMNGGGTDFIYSAGLTYVTGVLNTTGLKITPLSVTTSPEVALAYVVGSGDGTFGTSLNLKWNSTTGLFTVGSISTGTINASGSVIAVGSLEGANISLTTGATVDTIETTLTNDNTHLPTSGAVYAAIAAVPTQILTLGTNGQMPFMNVGGTDFSYSASLGYFTGVFTAPNVAVSAIASGLYNNIVFAAPSTGQLGNSPNLYWDGTNLYTTGLTMTGATVSQIETTLTNSASRLATSSAIFAAIAAVPSVSFGSSGQIPYMNVGGTDFSYTAALTYATGILTTSALTVSSLSAGTTPQLLTSAVGTGVIQTNTGLTWDGSTFETSGNIKTRGGGALFYSTSLTDSRITMNPATIASVYYYDDVLATFRDFRFGSNTTNEGIYWDDSANRVGILNDAPSYTLDVNGETRATSFYIGTDQQVVFPRSSYTAGSTSVAETLIGSHSGITNAIYEGNLGNRVIRVTVNYYYVQAGATGPSHVLRVKLGTTTLISTITVSGSQVVGTCIFWITPVSTTQSHVHYMEVYNTSQNAMNSQSVSLVTHGTGNGINVYFDGNGDIDWDIKSCIIEVLG